MREMEPGIYTNYFQVQINNLNESVVMYADVEKIGSARDVRPKVQAHIVQLGPTLFGYGPHSDLLLGLGFSKVTLDMLENPALVSRMIVDGFLDHLETLDYVTERAKIKHRVYHPERAIETSIRQVRIMPGCQLRSSFFSDPLKNEIVYGLVLDPWFRIELNGQPANFNQIRQFANSIAGIDVASAIVPEVMMKVGMLTPYRRRNRESFKAKVERMMAIVREAKEFPLSGNSICRIIPEPTKVMMLD